MTKAGRPRKEISENEYINLKIFLESSRFLNQAQQRVLDFIHLPLVRCNPEQIKAIKVALRQQQKQQQYDELLNQLKLKQQQNQRLNKQELEILAIAQGTQDRDQFFCLQRVLATYLKLGKAIEENRIQLEQEKIRQALKQRQAKSEYQTKRNAENQLKYALGGLLLSVFKEKHYPVNLDSLEFIREKLREQLKLR